MAAFNFAAMLQQVATIVSGLTGLQQEYIGAPEAIDARVAAYVTLGDATPRPRANQVAIREPEIMVTFVYRVAGSEQTAELLIASLVDELSAAIFADRTLAGTSDDAVMDMTMNRQPAYMAIAGAEFRRYIVVITGKQTTSTP